ncbi:hypothetical protein GQ600_6396 [Phytophthora cactorum]|nr:hypothetical protein GQ600_6396 [Phytophthora cactorum]
MTKKGALQKLLVPTASELHAHIGRWLIHDVAAEAFRLLVKWFIRNPDVTFLSCHMFNDTLSAWLRVGDEGETFYASDPSTNIPTKQPRRAPREVHSLGRPSQGAYFQNCEKYDKPVVSKKISLTEWHRMTELEAVTESQADLAWIQAQRIDQVASKLMVLLRLAVDRLNSGLRSQSSTKAEAKREIAPGHRVDVNALSTGTQNGFSVDSLVRPGAYATAADQETADTTSDAAQANRNADVDEVIMEGHRTLRDAHRDVLCAMHATASDDREGATMDAPPNLELVPALMRKPAKWYNYTVQQAAAKSRMRTTARVCCLCVVVTRYAGGFSAYSNNRHLPMVYRDGSDQSPPRSRLAGRSSSNAFQECVFSTGGFIMRPLRSSTDNERAEMHEAEPQQGPPYGGRNMATGSEAIRSDVIFEDGAQAA